VDRALINGAEIYSFSGGEARFAELW
jgi:hypothetical protein